MGNDIIIISVFVIFSLSLICYSMIRDFYWRKKKLINFPIKYRGKIFWFSRSVAVAMFTFCKNAEGKLCVLANRRGEGTPDFQGYWNSPCGYLDFDEDGKEAAQRETAEETGIFVDKAHINTIGVNTDPKDNSRQNVTIHYSAFLEDKVTDDLKFDTSHSEKNEVSDIKWIPIDELDNYKWAFKHKDHIVNAAKAFTDK